MISKFFFWIRIYVNILIDLFYSKYKKHHPTGKVLQIEDIKKIRDISHSAYPETSQMWDEINCIDDIFSIICAHSIEQVFFLLNEEWYIVVVEHFNYIEIVDFASATKRHQNIFQTISDLVDKFQNKRVHAFCFENTSYPLLLIMEKRGKCKILSDKKGILGNDVGHRVVFKYLKKQKN